MVKAAHTQAQRLAAMFPTLEPEPAVDPRTAIDDEVNTLLATRGEQFKARMYQQLNLRGMTCQHANDILVRLGLR